MKNLCVLIICFGVLFLTGCQKNEEIASVKDEAAVTFKKVGDPRSPVEFMSPEKIKEMEAAFESMKGKTFKGSIVEVTEPETRGRVKDRDTYYLMTEDDVPVTPTLIDGGVLYICVEMEIQKKDWSFSYVIDYAIGQTAYSTCFTSPNDFNHNQGKDSYIMEFPNAGFYRIFTDNQCSFEIPLKNTPGYSSARITFPFQMQWDQRVNFTNSCGMFIDTRYLRIQYL